MAVKHLEFKIYGMDCVEEVAVLKNEVGSLVGHSDNLAVNLLKGKMTVSLPSGTISSDMIVKAVERAGMRAEVWSKERDEATGLGLWQRRRRTILTAGSGFLTVAGLLYSWASVGLLAAMGSEGAGINHELPLAARLLYGLGVLAGGWYVFPKAWLALRRLRPDMNLLMTIAVVGAAVIGEWFEASTVSFLFGLSLALESWSVGRARRAVGALIDLTPTTVRLLDGKGREVVVAPGEVPIGSLFLVKPAERIPLDGEVVRGASDVNQAPITGESVPVPKEAGAQVFAGSINGDGALEVRSSKAAGDTTLAQIVRMVGEAQSRRAPSEQWVERFARVYTPIVLATALSVAILPPVFAGGWSEWFYRALLLLVIGCPCALVISTPVSIVASLAAAARNGVLVKGGIHMEAPARLQAVALDKTGTLTLGQPHVVEVAPINGHTQEELLARAAALESRSDHPLARAIVTQARERGIAFATPDEFQIVQGKGAMGRFDGKLYWLGSHRYLEERGQETPEVHRRLTDMCGNGRTVVVIGTSDHVCGFVGLADAVRPEARRSVQELRNAGIRHIVMLTGDNRGTAEQIAAQTGVDETRAELLPADKMAAVDELVHRYGAVAMAGDGINDAPAMGRATLGIAMGAAGSDAAIEAADVALMSDDLAKLPWLVRHSTKTLRIVRQNIALSLSVKGIFVVLTFAGAASLWAAIAADMGVSLLVVSNALRLIRPHE
jgi:Cd2+/Zn2+-exporting ATPase